MKKMKKQGAGKATGKGKGTGKSGGGGSGGGSKGKGKGGGKPKGSGGSGGGRGGKRSPKKKSSPAGAGKSNHRGKTYKELDNALAKQVSRRKYFFQPSSQLISAGGDTRCAV